jgi:hypothetical protein
MGYTTKLDIIGFFKFWDKLNTCQVQEIYKFMINPKKVDGSTKSKIIKTEK